MFNSIIRASIKYRYVVLSLSFLVALVGAFSYSSLIIDAVPDITNVQVQINSEAVGYSPLEAEQRITLPIERFLSGMPSLDYTRSLSRYGLSQVTVVFKDGTDIYFARQLVAQKIAESKDRLPVGINPSMGPIATGLGEIFMFTVENALENQNKKNLSELREIQDWIIKPQLRTVPGVVEVNSIGGNSKQIVVSPNLNKLRSYGLTLDDISMAIARNNSNVGAGFIEQDGEQFLLRVPAQIKDYRELNQLFVSVYNGTPVYLEDVSSVQIGTDLRTGAATENGKEVVLGTVFMQIGENGREVSEQVSKRIKEIAPSLPKGVVVKPVYDRTNLIDATILTVKKNLAEGALLVVFILFLTLGNIRAALITACIIPIAMLMTIFGMVQGHLSANLMSLGALDFGLLVDGAVILVENCIKRFGDEQSRLGRLLNKEERLSLVFKASSEVRQATMFGELIIMIVYVPILALSGIEGKMFHPMALTVLIALASAFVLSLTFVPAAVAVFITGPVSHQSHWMDRLQGFYRRSLEMLLRHSHAVIGVSALTFLTSLLLFTRLGAEFIPSLDEGDIALHALRIPGTSLNQAIKMQHQLEQEIMKIPEVSHSFAKIGTAEIATDPMPPSVADGFIMMKPRSEWPDPALSKSALVSKIEEKVLAIPGNNYEFTQPIQMRFNELIAGVRSDVAIKVFGDDSQVLLKLGEDIKNILKNIRGSSDVKVEQVTGLPLVEIRPDSLKLSRLGLSSSDVQDAVRMAYAGEEASNYFEGDRSFPIVVRLSDNDRSDKQKIANLLLPLPSNQTSLFSAQNPRTNRTLGNKERYVLLGDVAEVVSTEGPNQISRENGKRRVVVTVNVRDRDLGSFVSETQREVAMKLDIPSNYWLGWGGQYENLISAKERLTLVVPLVLLSVFGLIWFTFKSFKYSILVFTGIPFALSGGIFALWVRGIPFSISAAVGFIALSGVAVLNGLVLVSFTRKLFKDSKDLVLPIIDGAVSRLRPVLMTALVASLGFLPMAMSQGTGSEVQRPLATVVIGGIISSTVLTLFVLPCLMLFLRKRED